jgi:hypothetical protein
MQDTIFLRCDHTKVLGMTKGVPNNTYRGELIIKVRVKVDPKAYGNPVIEQEIEVTDWTEGIAASMVDVKLDRPFITEEEAAMIREKRIIELADMLRETGRYEITDLTKGEEEEE